MVNKAKMKRVMPKLTPIARVKGQEPMILPNHSRGKSPESDKGLANKKYVDDSIDADITTHTAIVDAHHTATVSGDIDHDATVNTHNLTTDIDHDTITNNHNLTTDIDHDQLTNYVAGEHFLQSAITQISASVGNGILKNTSGVLAPAVAGTDYLTDIVQDTSPTLGGDLDANSKDITAIANAEIDTSLMV